MDAVQWSQALNWVPDGLWRQFHPTLAMQSDVNGMPRSLSEISFAAQRPHPDEIALDRDFISGKPRIETQRTAFLSPRAFASQYCRELVGRGSRNGRLRDFQAVCGVQPERNSFRMLAVRQISFHSSRTLPTPRKLNRRKPRRSLIWPKTGSTMAFLIL
jgi:hypothetical protein